MSERENSGSPSSNHSPVNNIKSDKKSKSKSREPSNSKSNHKGRRSHSRSPRKMSYKGSKYRSRSRSPRRRSRRTYSRSRSRSYSPKKKDRRSTSHSPMSSRRRHTGNRENPLPSRCLGVFGLSVYTTEQELLHIFSKYGPVERVQVVIDAKTGRSRGFAFCYFESVEDAKIAKEQCSGMEFDGRRIRVDYSITQRAHTPTPGIYMGKPTFVGGRDREYGGRGWDRRERDDYYGGGGGGYRSSYRRSPSPYYRRPRRYERSRSRSYSPH